MQYKFFKARLDYKVSSPQYYSKSAGGFQVPVEDVYNTFNLNEVVAEVIM